MIPGEKFSVEVSVVWDGTKWIWFDDTENERRLKKLIRVWKASRSDVGWKTFEGFMAKVLVSAVRVMKDAEVIWLEDRADKNSPKIKKFVSNVILRKDLDGVVDNNIIARIQDLKWFGLLAQRPEWWHQGIYVATPLLFDFIDGRARVCQSVRIIEGEIVDQSQETIGFVDAVGAEWNTISDWIRDWRGSRVASGEITPSRMIV